MKPTDECLGTNVRGDLTDRRILAPWRILEGKELLDFELLQKIVRT
jgi:hypothetical protein